MSHAPDPHTRHPVTRFQAAVQHGIDEFVHTEVSGSMVLLVATIAAMILANSPWAESYFQFWKTSVGFKLGEFTFFETLQHWINDFLMAFFFFVIGLEIKREVLAGELSSLRKATLPIMAAIGGMLVPAALYIVVNAGSNGSGHGWGVPMATDIAFALGVVALLGSRAPTSLKVFLTALAVADDIGAVLVIAIFYTDKLDLNWLAIGGGLLVLLFLFSLLRFRSRLIFLVAAMVIWFAFFESGVHATLAGVLVALVIPCRTSRQPLEFVSWAREQLARIETLHKSDSHPLERAEEQEIANTLQIAARQVQSPLHRLERSLHPITSFIILPLFALCNAGIPLTRVRPLEALSSPVSLGILLGLIVGKQIGITFFTWAAVKLKLSELPDGLTWRMVYGASWLGGIGFTMSIFIASLAFRDPEILAQAKLSILIASLIAGLGGYITLRLASGPAEQTADRQPQAQDTMAQQ